MTAPFSRRETLTADSAATYLTGSEAPNRSNALQASDAAVIKSQPGFMEKYGYYVHVTAALMTALFLVVIALTAMLAYRRKGEKLISLSEQRYRYLFEQSPVGIIIADTQNNYLDANGKLCEMLGYTRKELTNVNASTIIAQNGNNTRTLEATLKGSAQGERWDFRKKDGSTFIGDVLVSQMPDGKILKIVRDVTDQIDAENALLASQEKFRDLYENSPDMYATVDTRTAVLLECNQTLATKLGYSKNDIIGRTIFNIYQPDSLPDARIVFRTFRKTGVVTNAELQLKKMDGGTIDAILNVSSVYGKDGKPTHSRCAWRDITEQKRADHENRRLEQQLYQFQKVEAIGTLASGIAHDFNNLLTPILAYADLTKMEFRPGDKGVKYLDNIMASASRAKDLVLKILIISRSSLENAEEVQLNHLLQDVLTVLQISVSKDIKIQKGIENHLPAIFADSSQIYQVILNLCTNAIQAMPDGGDLLIQLYKTSYKNNNSSKNSHLCLTVRDNGLGMDENTIKRIYEPFFTTKEKGEQRGTGLGLSIVSNIVKHHNGHIEVESTLGEGTVFRVFFPTIEVGQLAKTKPLEAMPETGHEHILLVDDEEMLSELATTILENKGYKITCFSDSRRGLQALRNNPYDFQLLITDYSMPHLTGPELMKFAREVRPDIPMLLITGYSNLATPENLREWGCNGIVAKPYNVDQLSQVVAQALAEERSKAQLTEDRYISADDKDMAHS